MTRLRVTLVLLLSLLIALSGCAGRNQLKAGNLLKADVLEAVRRQESVRNYRFSGMLEHGNPSAGREERPSSGLWSLIPPAGTFSWQGVASFDPLRAEAEIGIDAPDRDFSTVSLFIQHNKMIFQLPGLKESGPYFSVDLGELAERNGMDGPTPLSGAGVAFAEAMAAFVGNMDAALFDEPEKSESGRRIIVTFATDQAEAFGRFWDAARPEMEAALAGFRPESKNRTDGAKASVSSTVHTLHEPARFLFDLNEAGYLEQFRADLDISWLLSDGTTDRRRVRLVSRIDDINENPSFVRPVPEETIPFERLLELVETASRGENGPETRDGTQNP